MRFLETEDIDKSSDSLAWGNSLPYFNNNNCLLKEGKLNTVNYHTTVRGSVRNPTQSLNIFHSFLGFGTSFHSGQHGKIQSQHSIPLLLLLVGLNQTKGHCLSLKLFQFGHMVFKQMDKGHLYLWWNGDKSHSLGGGGGVG